MESGKYIIAVTGSGCEVAICFDNILTHSDIAYGKEVLSAGFFAVGAKPSENDKDDIDVCVYGKSVSLKLEVRKGTDERLIKRVLRKEYNY